MRFQSNGKNVKSFCFLCASQLDERGKKKWKHDTAETEAELLSEIDAFRFCLKYSNLRLLTQTELNSHHRKTPSYIRLIKDYIKLHTQRLSGI